MSFSFLQKLFVVFEQILHFASIDSATDFCRVWTFESFLESQDFIWKSRGRFFFFELSASSSDLLEVVGWPNIIGLRSFLHIDVDWLSLLSLFVSVGSRIRVVSVSVVLVLLVIVGSFSDWVSVIKLVLTCLFLGRGMLAVVHLLDCSKLLKRELFLFFASWILDLFRLVL